MDNFDICHTLNALKRTFSSERVTYAFEGALNKGKIYSDDEEFVARSEKSQKFDHEPSSDEAKKTELNFLLKSAKIPKSATPGGRCLRPKICKRSPSSTKRVLTEDEIYDASTDYSDSPVDTDEEIERAKRRQRRKAKINDPIAESSNSSKKHKLDENEPQSSNANFDEDGLPILPEFFRNMIFLIHCPNISQIVRKQLNRYIVAFGGDLENYMNDKVTHVLTNEKWTDDFEEASRENSKLLFVNLDWVLECGRLEKLVDIGAYLILK
uniref:BRCT domain-containing protein n=1 Tax=Romanomermis culicivorax TaxID=13658 RepID=A0A915IBL1_ROMCU